MKALRTTSLMVNLRFFAGQNHYWDVVRWSKPLLGRHVGLVFVMLILISRFYIGLAWHEKLPFVLYWLPAMSSVSL
jgi:hypothetical protein